VRCDFIFVRSPTKPANPARLGRHCEHTMSRFMTSFCVANPSNGETAEFARIYRTWGGNMEAEFKRTNIQRAFQVKQRKLLRSFT
jgi:hypothetical protein